MLLDYQKDGVEAWADAYPSPERAVVEIVEIAPMPFTFTLTPPSATPEPVDPKSGRFSPAWPPAGVAVPQQRSPTAIRRPASPSLAPPNSN